MQLSVEGERLDYYVISGKTPMGTVEKYTELTRKTGTASRHVLWSVADHILYHQL